MEKSWSVRSEKESPSENTKLPKKQFEKLKIESLTEKDPIKKTKSDRNHDKSSVKEKRADKERSVKSRSKACKREDKSSTHEEDQRIRSKIEVETVETSSQVAFKNFKIPKLKQNPLIDDVDIKPAVPSIPENAAESSHQTWHPHQKPDILHPYFNAPGPCKNWLEGSCSKTEEECPYSHYGIVEVKLRKCKFYSGARTKCAKGKACCYMHETYPCKAFHAGIVCDSGESCKFSHAPLDDDTESLFRQEVVQMVSDIKENIQDEILTEEKQRSLMRLHAIRAVAVNMNIVIPDDSVEDDESLMAKSSKVETTGQEVDFAGYHGPNGGQSTLRYALHGTFGNYKYAQENMDKFEAYEEMERRVQTLYNHISIDNYSTLSEQLRGII